MLVIKRMPQEAVVIFDKDNQVVGKMTMQYGFRTSWELGSEYLIMREELLETITPDEFRRDRERIAS